MVRALLLLSLALPSLALAQAMLQLSLPSGTEAVTVSGAQCEDTLQVTWAAGNVAPLCADSLVIWSTTAATCPSTEANTDLHLATLSGATWTALLTDSVTIPVNGLAMFKGTDPAVCGAEGLEKTNLICASFGYRTPDAFGNCGQKTDVGASSSVSIIYDSKAPAAPTIEEVSSQDKGLSVRFTAPSDAERVHLEVREQGAVDFERKASATREAGSAKLSGLNNNTTYDLRAIAADAAGNESAPSEIVSGTPMATDGFFTSWVRAGGKSQGCASAAGLAPGLSALALAWLFSRRKRR